jgi:hypothetical protein
MKELYVYSTKMSPGNQGVFQLMKMGAFWGNHVTVLQVPFAAVLLAIVQPLPVADDSLQAFFIICS